MAELKDLLKYLPEAVGYFQGRRAINQEMDRLRNQDPVQIDRLQMAPATSAAFRRANTRGDVEQQTNIDRQVQEAIRRNPRNVAKAIEAGQAASAKAANTDEAARLANLRTASTLADRLNARNMAIDERNALRERAQENAVAAAEANRTRLNMRGLGTLGDLIGDAASLIPSNENPYQNLDQVETRTVQKIDQPEGVELLPIEERGLVGGPQPVGNLQEILAQARAEDEADMSGVDLQLSRNEDNTIFTDSEYDRRPGVSTLIQLLDENELNSLGAYTAGKNTVPRVIDPTLFDISGLYRTDGPRVVLEEGGAVVTPDGYDHDGVDINMTDAESGRFLGSVESAEMIVNTKDTEEGLKLAKKNPNNPLSKWYLKLTERFRKEAEEREAQNKR